LEVEEMAKVNSVLEKTPEKRGVKRRAPLEDLGNITPTKNNPCDAVLSSLKKARNSIHFHYRKTNSLTQFF
jgi:hypothetical protein